MAKLSAEELKKLPVYDGTSMATAGKDTLLYIDKATTTGKKPTWVLVGETPPWNTKQILLMDLTRLPADGERRSRVQSLGASAIQAC